MKIFTNFGFSFFLSFFLSFESTLSFELTLSVSGIDFLSNRLFPSFFLSFPSTLSFFLSFFLSHCLFLSSFSGIVGHVTETPPLLFCLSSLFFLVAILPCSLFIFLYLVALLCGFFLSHRLFFFSFFPINSFFLFFFSVCFFLLSLFLFFLFSPQNKGMFF